MPKKQSSTQVDIGIIGGSGVYNIEGLENIQSHTIITPFGRPSDIIKTGELSGKACAFLPRHGKGHRILPGEINYRANIYALKSLGVKRILSLSACGSLKEEIHPRDMVFPDQFFDRTKGRISTFFGNGIAGHVGFADPLCSDLSSMVYKEAVSLGFKAHNGGTYVCMEGPMFSTRAESHFYRAQGFSIIGMTNLTEAKLAREAEICYASISLVTDFDVWKEDEEVSVGQLIENLKANTAHVKKLLTSVVKKIPSACSCGCQSALQYAVITNPKAINYKTYNRMKLLIGKYIKK